MPARREVTDDRSFPPGEGWLTGTPRRQPRQAGAPDRRQQPRAASVMGTLELVPQDEELRQLNLDAEQDRPGCVVCWN